MEEKRTKNNPEINNNQNIPKPKLTRNFEE